MPSIFHKVWPEKFTQIKLGNIWEYSKISGWAIGRLRNRRGRDNKNTCRNYGDKIPKIPQILVLEQGQLIYSFEIL